MPEKKLSKLLLFHILFIPTFLNFFLFVLFFSPIMEMMPINMPRPPKLVVLQTFTTTKSQWNGQTSFLPSIIHVQAINSGTDLLTLGILFSTASQPQLNTRSLYSPEIERDGPTPVTFLDSVQETEVSFQESHSGPEN